MDQAGVAGDTALLPAARMARDRLVGRGRVLTRDSLAEQLREDGHAVGNVRVSALLTTLRSERATTAGK